MILKFENEKSGFRVYEEEDGSASIVYRLTTARVEVFTKALYEGQKHRLDAVASAYLRSIIVHDDRGEPFGEPTILTQDDPDNPLYVLAQYQQDYWPNPEPPL
jgi:hypothetical protein